MCGRATHRLTWEEIHRLYRLTAPPSNFEPSYNVCPTDPIYAVIERDGQREILPMRWGLIPWWWRKTPKEAGPTWNARAETVAETRMFRDAFKRNRCLIPISGFFEWEKTPDGKQPYYITRVDGTPITVAGLWDEWRNPDTGERLKSCTMVVTDSNDLLRDIHDRMPVVLEPDTFDAWLSGEAGEEVLKPAAGEVLVKSLVSRRVNSSKAPADDPTLIEPLDRAA
jgi:putative SOS response-associated peptidase YedK